jgi:hypothetical protein
MLINSTSAWQLQAGLGLDWWLSCTAQAPLVVSLFRQQKDTAPFRGRESFGGILAQADCELSIQKKIQPTRTREEAESPTSSIQAGPVFPYSL